jgi:excisionase family DNA binding protein
VADVDYMTIEETAKRLSVSTRQVYRLIDSGALVAIKLGKLRRVSVASYDALRARLEAEARGARPADDDDRATD